mgnify:CR=1 FL=1
MKVGDIVRIKKGYAWGRSSSLSEGSILVKITEVYSKDFEAVAIDPKLSQSSWAFKNDEVIPMRKPKHRGQLIGEAVYQP